MSGFDKWLQDQKRSQEGNPREEYEGLLGSFSNLQDSMATQMQELSGVLPDASGLIGIEFRRRMLQAIYFLLASVGYLAYVMRLWLPFNISIVLTNFFVLSSAYCVVLGLLWRYKRNIHFYYFPIVLHVGIYTLTQLLLGILYPDEPMYRLILIYIN